MMSRTGDFYNYFMSIYSNMNKFKSFNLIKADYSNNLLWITQSDVPSEVREHVLKLKKDALKY